MRTGNEDSVHLEPAGSPEARARGTLCVVADGMGGYAAGELASRMAVQGIRNRYYAGPSTYIVDALRSAIETTNLEIWQQAQRQAETNGMGCTLTAAVILGNDLVIGHVGDSRAYLVRNDSIAQITRDHSWVEEQVEAGALTREQANRHPQRNVILRALGARSSVTVDIFQEKLENGDVVVLCSDGLTTLVSDDEIGRGVLDATPDVAVRQLVATANQRGAPDNVTVAALRVHGPRRNALLRLRRWWPFVAAGVVLVALASGLAVANRAPTPPAPTPTAATTQAPAAALLPTNAPQTSAPQVALPPAAATPSPAPSVVVLGEDMIAVNAFLRGTPSTDDSDPSKVPLSVGTVVQIIARKDDGPLYEGLSTWYQVNVPSIGRSGWVWAGALNRGAASIALTNTARPPTVAARTPTRTP